MPSVSAVEKEYMGRDMPWMLMILVILTALLMFAAMFMSLVYARQASAQASHPPSSDYDSDHDNSTPTVPAACPSGQLLCGSHCIDPQTDAGHCGTCGTACTGTTPACCTGTCADLDSSTTDCGSCGNPCPMTATCEAGLCVCGIGEILCTDTVPSTCITNDENACLACYGHPCMVEGAICTDLICNCPLGQTNCSMVCVDTQTDVQNCHQCGTPCPSVLHAQATCTSGVCGFICDSGWGNCGDTNQCDTDLNTDTNACGSCDIACTGTCPVCISGICFDTC